MISCKTFDCNKINNELFDRGQNERKINHVTMLASMYSYFIKSICLSSFFCVPSSSPPADGSIPQSPLVSPAVLVGIEVSCLDYLG